ncbi:MAG: beta-3-deoxy-D-manno-oct-2-ulosonic acid transferase [Hydrocarboniphaga sp.]|uniref:capsular polysaccharide export protein, LipB/KpsS family n=1 Tax=Hydrocarboniphaga sp. TaxID=2033016 RepID=UPI00263560D0|nr:hypothetical protein [Hydrocarboniphaga sp.]MDB5972035.1 beta-3-deoxy-D-manno-oct-2-ulosonic acid transferase [Hydrocarboniphaga sp.]
MTAPGRSFPLSAPASAAAVPSVVLGIKPWKRWQIRRFLGPGVVYTLKPERALREQARRGGGIAVWAAREPAGFAAAAAAQNAPLLRIEDGFLRSVGLGSNHVGGASLVVDAEGIYFDSRTPSALEKRLQAGGFEPALLNRAAALRRSLIDSGLSKYNIGERRGVDIGGATGQRRLLVVGQVENDASLRLGSPLLRGNLELLRRVRAAEPQAWIVYKPHPDTEAGTRPGALADAAVLSHADQIVRGVSITTLFGQIDALHTLTSLAGFEALLRGVAVTTWGQPFYAGWGLTDERAPNPRRTRRLTLDELVAGALIVYPRYADPRTGAACEVEAVVAQLAAAGAAGSRGQRSRLRRYTRLLAGLLRGALR